MRAFRIILLLSALSLAACQSAAPPMRGLAPAQGRSGDFLWRGGAYTLGQAAPRPEPEAPARVAARP